MIADASALLFLGLRESAEPILHERLRRSFVRIHQREGLQAPPVLAYELGNVIHRKRARDAGSTLDERSILLEKTAKMADPNAESTSLRRRTGELCERLRISFYDAAYLAHAEATTRSIVTADAGLQAHAEALGLRAYLLPRDLGRLEADYPSEPQAPTRRP